jgi:hypothetical protein
LDMTGSRRATSTPSAVEKSPKSGGASSATARRSRSKSARKGASKENDENGGVSTIPEAEVLNFDLNLPDSASEHNDDQISSSDARRKSFFVRAKTGELNRHVTFGLLAFAFFSLVLGPFLYIPSSSSNVHCDGMDILRISNMEADVKRLQKELLEAIDVNNLEKKRAMEALDAQKVLVVSLTEDIVALEKKQGDVLAATKFDIKDASMSIDGTTSVNTPDDLNNIFNSFRKDVKSIGERVKMLVDIENLVKDFSSNASKLSLESLELRAKIEEESRLLIPCNCDTQPVDITPPDGASLIDTIASCPVCPIVEPCQECDVCAMVNTDAAPTQIEDFVNVPMARELVADLVTRKCAEKVEDIRQKHNEEFAKFKESLHAAFDGDIKTNELLQTEKAMRLHNVRKDFALARSGASIQLEHTSETYVPPEWDVTKKTRKQLEEWTAGGGLLAKPVSAVLGHTAFDDVLEFATATVGVDKGVGAPEDAISESMALGSCWPMEGSSGTIAIKLSHKVAISAISIDHIPRNEALNINSAPRDFRVTGSTTVDGEYRTLVEGSYSIEDGSLYSQIFPLSQRTTSLSYVRLEVLNNHGNDNFTCLYRIRVHGDTE